jgi:hypothetical protein
MKERSLGNIGGLYKISEQDFQDERIGRMMLRIENMLEL